MGTGRGMRAALVAILAVPIAVVCTPLPAHAAPAWEIGWKSLLGRTAGWAEQGLGRTGGLAQPLPLLDVSPGALADADHIVRALADKVGSDFTARVDNSDPDAVLIVDQPAGADHVLDLTLRTHHAVQAQNLSVGGITVAHAVNIDGWATARIKLVYRSDSEIYLIRDAESPRVDVDAAASLRSDIGNATAAIGILGVSLTAGSALVARTHLRAVVTDPDHDGKLSFDTAAGPGTGELAAPGALTGLINAGFDPGGGTKDGRYEAEHLETGAGSIDPATIVKLGPATSAFPIGGGPINATITVNWTDVSTGAPTVSVTGLDQSIARFKNMSLLDLASGMAQLATLLGAVQASGGTGNLNLPFLRGTFADAVKINEKIVGFLQTNVYPKPGDPTFHQGDDPARAGQPKFTSVQEMLSLLQTAGLLSGPVTFDTDKLAFTLHLAVASGSAATVALDPAAAKASGTGATYSAQGLSVPTDRFAPGSLTGQRIVAGTSAGTIHDNTASSITLDGGWVGGQPTDTSPWTITGSAANIGAVEFGGTLAHQVGDKRVGLRAANAAASFATVKPSYDATMTLMLDLHDIPNATPEQNADRVLLHTDPATPLFTANFPIDTDITFPALAGFLKVNLGGQLSVGPATAGAPMVQVTFQQARDVSLGTLFQELHTVPTSLVNASSSVRTTGHVSVSVPGATGALATGAGLDVAWTAGQAPEVDTSGLADLIAADFNPDDPKALLAAVVESLRLIDEGLSANVAPSTNPAAGLDTKIPLLGRTPRQLLGSDNSGIGRDVSYAQDGANFLLKDGTRTGASAFADRLKGRTVVIGSKAYRVLAKVDDQTLRIDGTGVATLPEPGSAYALRPELLDALDALIAAPPDNLQDALAMLTSGLGAGSGLTFTIDRRPGGPYLRIGMDWRRAFHAGGPLIFGWSGAQDLISADTAGSFAVDVTGRADLGLLLPLHLGAAAPQLDQASSASLTVAGSVTNLAMAANIGPLGVDLGKDPNFGTAQANLSLSLSGLTADGSITDLLAQTPHFTTAGTDCGSGVGGADKALCVRAPVTVSSTVAPDCQPQQNTLSLQLTADLQASGTTPDLSACLNSLVLNLTSFNGGLDGYLAKIEEALRLASLGGKLPLVGDDLQQGKKFIADLRQHLDEAVGPLAHTDLTNVGLQDLINTKLHDVLGSQMLAGSKVTIDCQDGVASPCNLTQFKSVRLTVDVQQGNPSAGKGCANAATPCLGTAVPLNIGIPGLSLKAADGATSGVSVGLGWKLHLDLVLDRTEGFYIPTHSGSSATPELQIGAYFDVASDLDAQLAFIKVNAHKRVSTPFVRAYFAVDLRSGGAEESCFDSGDPKNPTVCRAVTDGTDHLTLAHLGDLGAYLRYRVSANVNIDWDLAAKIDTGDPNGIGSALPGVSARFLLTWGFSNQTGEFQPSGLKISFTDIAIDAGAFFSRILGPVIQKIKAVTGPLQPVIDTLYAPVPVLSDLSRATGNPDITLIWLAKQFSTLAGGPKLDFVDTVRSVIDFINHMPAGCTTQCKIPIGKFEVNPVKAFTTAVTPASAQSLIDHPDALSDTTVKGAIDTAAGSDAAKKLFTPDANHKTNADKTGFKFPIFDNPASLFGLLLGQDVELISFDSGPLSLGFSWRQSFGPVYAPPPVMITLSGSASVTARFMAGLDTAGIRHAIEAASKGTSVNVISLLDGLYFKTVDDKGNAVPVVTLRGEIGARAEVTVLFLKAGVEGGVRLTVGFSWNDPNNDGKFRTSEFLQALLTNPICLFTTTGQLSVFLKVYITIDLVLFSKTFDFTLVNAVLLDFKAQPDCSPPPPELAGVTGSTLVVFAGKFGQSPRGNAIWSNRSERFQGDVFKIYALHYADAGEPDASPDFDGFAVEALGRREQFLDPDLTTVVVDGRTYHVDDASKTAMSIVFLSDGNPDGGSQQQPTFDKTAIVIGSKGKDEIRTGSGPAYVDAGEDNDTIVTAEAPGLTSWVAGGDDDDTISTGGGDNIVAGDGTLGAADLPDDTIVATPAGNRTLAGLVDWNALQAPDGAANSGGGADHVTGGSGANHIYGNAGADVLAVNSAGTKANVIVGGAGGDVITGGGGDDQIYAYDQNVPAGPDEVGAGDVSLTNSIDTAGGQDSVYGSAGTDLVISHSANGQTGHIYGYGGNDVLTGGYGTDEIYGGPGEDYVLAEPSTVGTAGADDGFGPARAVTHQPLPPGVVSQSKLLVGGLGRDHIIGGDGGARIFGDEYLPAEACADTYADGQPRPADQGAADLIVGGAGTEVVSAGSGNDSTDLGVGDDRACGQRGDDTMSLGDGADRAWGGDGVDVIHGGGGNDREFGNAGNDGVYGDAGNDTLQGNAGTDNVFGGVGEDVIYGGTDAPAQPDAADFLYGDDGLDRIIGDNGTPQVMGVGPFPFDLAGDVPGAGAGDVISGGPDADTIYGGLGNDTLHGDTGDDVIEGNNGADLVHGDDGHDEIIGGSSQEQVPGTGRPDGVDLLFGDAGADLIAGDNAQFAATGTPTRLTLARSIAARAVTLLDLGFSPQSGTGAADVIDGGSGGDVLFGQAGPDRILAGPDDDYAEGGPASDWIEGGPGQDDLIGGSSTPDTVGAGQPDTADVVFGGPGSDVVLGDNGTILNLLAGEAATGSTVRLGADGVPMHARVIVALDRAAPADVLRFGADRISGGDGVDVLVGQDGDDAISGDGDGDYLEGNGGRDTLRGDVALSTPGHTPVTALPDPGWPGAGSAAADLTGSATPGQDDLIGGSTVPGFRDDSDAIEGDAGADVLLGDNGTLIRTIAAGAERVYTERYPAGSVPPDATHVRSHDPALTGPSTRFCSPAPATCEPVGAFGNDQLWGDAGPDGIWGQDGDDMISGGDGDDDIFGELGADTLYGDAGSDAVIGDRGGVMDQYINADDAAAFGFTAQTSGNPKETYTGFRLGSYDHRVDLLHDTDGDVWIGSPTSPAMAYNGYDFGGNDRIRGGSGADTVHGGKGEDLVNGDSGGDEVFGDSGSDILWGGKGCDPVLDAATLDCRTGGAFDPTARGTNDRFLDHVFGGAGATIGSAVTEILGSDLLDFKPRGTYPGGCATGQWPQTTGTVTVDPCTWFEMTGMDNDTTVGLGDNQHHQGTDWLYGGWDRDVLQGDVTENGPNPGDRLIDWDGSFNLYTVCNSSYGGYNSIRQYSPSLQDFLNAVAWGGGAGRTATDVITPGTSAYLEIALTQNGDQQHGSGSAYPGAPGHFNQPAACTD